MLGIIYRFTIVGSILKDGVEPFYIGQHWSAYSAEDFVRGTQDKYYGSGVYWLTFIDKLKVYKRRKWRNYLRREILYSSENITQKGLDVLEAYYIRKYEALDVLKKGGCNVLVGTANGFGSGSPMKLPWVAKKAGASLRRGYKEHPERIKRLSEIGKTLLGNKNPNFGNRWSWKKKIQLRKTLRERRDFWGDKNPNYANYWSDEQKAKMSKKTKEAYKRGRRNSMQDKKRITNGIINTVKEDNVIMPEGFRFGMAPRRKQGNELAVSQKLWITNGVVNRVILRREPIPHGFYKGKSLKDDES